MIPRPDLTFDRFTLTRGSSTAVGLALALAEDTANAPTFLLLHGPPGVGKTHLLQAIVNLRTARQPRRSLIQIEAAHLVEQWVAGLTGSTEAALPRGLERADLVAIDDLHTLAGKAMTQREVARAMQGTIAHGGRVVCTLGGSPAELPVLTTVLRRQPGARFVTMRPPRARELRQVLDVMARAEQLTLRRDALAAIADRCAGDVRRGQGELARCRFEQSHLLVRSSTRTQER